MHRLRPIALLRASWPVALWGVLPLVLGSWLALEVAWGHEGGAAKKKLKDYWRKNLATYRDAKTPDIKHVDLKLDLYPERRRYHVKGTFELIDQNEATAPRDPADGCPSLGKAELDDGWQAGITRESCGAVRLHSAGSVGKRQGGSHWL